MSTAAGAAVDILRTARDKAGAAASGALEAGKAALAAAASDADADAPPRHVDEVDLTPEEQLTRHHVELDPGKLHHWTPQREGPVAWVKHTAVRNTFASNSIMNCAELTE